jgi:methylmalonyl-CoA mutase N-terminal domain/subunit
VNKYFIEEKECPIDLHRIDPAVEEQQIENLRRLRRDRNDLKVKDALSRLHDDADKNINLMPSIIKAVKAYATVGEICDVLRRVYGVYKELIVI